MDWQKVGLGLRAFGAGVDGRGSEFLQQRQLTQKQQDVSSALEIKDLLKRGDVNAAKSLLQDKMQQYSQSGYDPTRIGKLSSKLNTITPADIPTVLSELDDLEMRAVRQGLIEPPMSEAAGYEDKIVDGQVVRRNADGSYTSFPIEGFQTTGRDGLASAKTTHYDNGTILKTLPSGEDVVVAPGGRVVTDPQERVNVLQQARKEQVEFARNKASATAEGQGNQGRLQQTIDTGLVAAQQMPVLRRTRDLLSTVKTGGFEKAALAAKRFFGIEAADEAELVNKMVKSAISQLRETFGAQFTEREGRLLIEAEANPGKSTAANMRILDQLIQLGEKKAGIATKAAKEAGDWFTRQQIDEYMKFELRDEAQPQQETPTVDSLLQKYGVQ